jgi:hypothetical protein
MDPYLILVDSQGQWLAQDDNGEGNGRNARLHFRGPKTGVYTVYATTKQAKFYGPQMVEIRR